MNHHFHHHHHHAMHLNQMHQHAMQHAQNQAMDQALRAQQEAERTKPIELPQAPEPMHPTGLEDIAMNLGLLVQAMIEKFLGERKL